MNKPLLDIKIAAKGRFRVQVLDHSDPKNIKEKDYGFFNNRIVNQGLDALGGVPPAAFVSGGLSLSQHLIAGIIVGTGNTAPAATDIVLAVPIAHTTTLNSESVSAGSLVAPYSNIYQAVYQFPVGGVVGNVAELGTLISNTSANYSAGAIYSRALTQSGGAPVVIVLTATDQLIVTYQNEWILTSDIAGSFPYNLDGAITTINYTARPYDLGSNIVAGAYVQQVDFFNVGNGPEAHFWTNTAYVATNANGTISAYPASRTMGAYTAGTYTRTFTAHWNTGNSFANRTMMGFLMNQMGFQCLFASPVTVTTTQVTDVTIQVSWANAS